MQELYEHDYVSRFNMCSWFKEQIMQNPDFTRMVLFSDEAVFLTQMGPLIGKTTVYGPMLITIGMLAQKIWRLKKLLFGLVSSIQI